MKRSTIAAVIQNKINKWLDSITDETLVKQIHDKIIVTGGCIPSMYLNEKVNDYDIYFSDYASALAVAKYYVSVFNGNTNIKTKNYIASYAPEVREIIRKNIKGDEERRIVLFMKSSGIAGEEQSEETYDYFENKPEVDATLFLSNPEEVVALTEDVRETMHTNKNKYAPLFLTDNAITLTDKIQIIIRFHGTPEEIHKNFDYVHATGWYFTGDKKLVVSERILEAILTKQLIYTGSLYPIASVFRMRKFLKRGWNISAGQILKILSQLKDMDYTNIEMLREQLAGVDVAYMNDLIQALNTTTERIDANYIAKLVDTIFED